MMQPLDICFSPKLFPAYANKNALVVIVDIFRATTSICSAFQNGATAIHAIADLEQAIKLKKEGHLLAAERNAQKCTDADFGNSPLEFTPDKVQGREIIFTTTNGTQAVEQALKAKQIAIGAFSNITALSSYCVKSNLPIIILCAGWQNHFCLEDTLFAGALVEKILHTEQYVAQSDAVKAAIELWNVAKSDLMNYICKTEHYQRLVKNNADDSVEFCLTMNTTTAVPLYDVNRKKFLLKE